MPEEAALPMISVWGFDDLSDGRDAPDRARVALVKRFFDGLPADPMVNWSSRDLMPLVCRWLRAQYPVEFDASWLPQGVVLAAAQEAGLPLQAIGGRPDGLIGIAETAMRQRIAECNACASQGAVFRAIPETSPVSAFSQPTGVSSLRRMSATLR